MPLILKFNLQARIHCIDHDPCSIEAKKVGSSTKRQLILETSVDPSQHGTVVDMVTLSMGGEEVLCYATSMGQLCGLDLRANRNAWQLSNAAKFGTGRLL